MVAAAMSAWPHYKLSHHNALFVSNVTEAIDALEGPEAR